jgi:hypothetical protein
MSMSPEETGGLPLPVVLDEIDRREAANRTDFWLARYLLTHALGENAIGTDPIEVIDGCTAQPIESDLSGVSTLQGLTVEGGRLQIPIAIQTPASAYATLVALWPRVGYAEVHDVEAEFAVPEGKTVTTPFGAVAQAIMEKTYDANSLVPGEGNPVYGLDGFLDSIDYNVPPGTTLTCTFTEPEAEGSGRKANIRFNGPLSVQNPMNYVGVEGDSVLRSPMRDTREPLLVNFPEDLTSFEISVPEDCERVVLLDGSLVSIHRGSPINTDGITTVEELQGQIDQLGSNDAEHFTFLYSGLLAIDIRGHRAIADTLGWIDATGHFLDMYWHKLGVKAQEIVTERISALGRNAIIEALNHSMANEGALVAGAMDVSIYLRDRIRNT